jgi:hypothetical protein
MDVEMSGEPDQRFSSTTVQAQVQGAEHSMQQDQNQAEGHEGMGLHYMTHSNEAHQPIHPPSHAQDSQPFSSASELDPSSRYASPPLYQQPNQHISRPSSGLSGSERPGYAHSQPERASAYQDQNYRPAHQQTDQAGKEKSTVVIKVGMVGDAQIGKTSLMVKYVEGSWDEDYIQTLGDHGLEIERSPC